MCCQGVALHCRTSNDEGFPVPPTALEISIQMLSLGGGREGDAPCTRQSELLASLSSELRLAAYCVYYCPPPGGYNTTFNLYEAACGARIGTFSLVLVRLDKGTNGLNPVAMCKCRPVSGFLFIMGMGSTGDQGRKSLLFLVVAMESHSGSSVGQSRFVAIV